MSYDLELVRLAGDGDRLAEARRAREAVLLGEQRGEEPEPSREKDERRARLAADLAALDPSLYVEPSARGPSYGCSIVTDDPDCPMPSIDIGVDEAIVTFPYSVDFGRIAPRLRRVLAVFESHGYVAYDRQSDSIVTSASDFEAQAASFQATKDSAIGEMQARGETVLDAPAPAKHFWTGRKLAVFLVLMIAIVLVQRYLQEERPAQVTEELRKLQDRLNRGSQTGNAQR